MVELNSCRIRWIDSKNALAINKALSINCLILAMETINKIVCDLENELAKTETTSENFSNQMKLTVTSSFSWNERSDLCVSTEDGMKKPY